MKPSTTAQLRILRTKKRLSDDPWTSRALLTSFLGFFGILALVMRATFISSSYGFIEAEIPVVPISVEDPNPSVHKEMPRADIEKTTPIVVLTLDEFFFGDLDAFSENFSNVRNKFFIKHQDGAPNIIALNQTMEKWVYARSMESIGNNGVVVLLPDKNVPLPIVIQTIAGLKKSKHFNQVVLANGIM